jgi:DNA-binding CsgD family transcriptional regulator
MRDSKQLSSLVGDVYDAAIDASLWPQALARVRAFIGGQAVVLCWKDEVNKCGCADQQDGGLDPHYVQLYFEKYIKMDPYSTGQFFASVGEPIGIGDLVPPNEILGTRFYNEWVRPQGLVDCVVSPLHKSLTSAALVGVFRHERHGAADGDSRKRMRLIVPHLRRALLIGKTLDAKASEAAALADTLDRINAGMFLVDARGRIVHANARGHALVAEGSPLRAPGGRLAANDAAVEQVLHEAFVAAGNGDAAIGTKGIAVPLLTRGDDRYVAHVLPLASGARRRAGRSYAAVAALFVHKAALETLSPPEVIAKTFKLTPSELRVLLGIVEVGGVPETAAALGIGEATVRTHLLRLYAKTGTNRQTGLVKLVAGFSNSLLGGAVDESIALSGHARDPQRR